MERRGLHEGSVDADLAAAFRDLHRGRLLGFAFLYLLGDRLHAERVTDVSLAAGVRRLAELRHPGRAAAWLRRHVVRSIRARRRLSPGGSAALERHGIPPASRAGLAALDRFERAALIAHLVEGLDLRDVARIVNRNPRQLDVLLARATSKYKHARARANAVAPQSPLAAGRFEPTQCAVR
jgi:DNA-directed RNA polymerase specialized sigma24 family protein